MKKFSLFLFLLSFLLQAQAQKQDYIPISISYYGEWAYHPGIKIGSEYTFWQRDGKEKPNKDRTHLHSFLVTGNLGFYVHPNNHTGITLTSDVGYRFRRRNGWRIENFLSLGYMAAINAGETYKLDANGQAKKVPVASRSYLWVGAVFGWGQDLAVHNIPIAWFLRHTVALQVPYNTMGFAPRLYIDIGLTYCIGRSF
ncbi:MAG: hypothetical protein GY810_23670 [Aureispira sp.]|nr:hypothetical protein [Aureispira sp.]